MKTKSNRYMFFLLKDTDLRIKHHKIKHKKYKSKPSLADKQEHPENYIKTNKGWKRLERHTG